MPYFSSYSSVFPNPLNYKRPLNHILSLDWPTGGQDYKWDHYVVLGVQTSSRAVRVREAKVTAWECVPYRVLRAGKATGAREWMGSGWGQGGAVGAAVSSNPDLRASR